MKMSGLFFGGLFWGILISLIGLSIILKYAFNIDLHIIRIFFGIIIILFGLKLIIGHQARHQVKNRKYVNYYHSSKDYEIIFSSGTIDLTKFNENQKIPGEVTVVFGNCVIIVPDSMNLEVSSTTVFGSTVLPDRSYAGFGEDTYLINNNPGAPVHKIETTTVFGKLLFEIIPSGIKADINPKPDTTQTETDQDF